MENLKKALTTLINITEKTDDALLDGKITIAEGVSIAMSAIGLISIIKNIKSLYSEYQNLSDAQLSELSIWFAQEFDISNDNTEAIIEMIFNALLNLSTVFVKISNAA